MFTVRPIVSVRLEQRYHYTNFANTFGQAVHSCRNQINRASFKSYFDSDSYLCMTLEETWPSSTRRCPISVDLPEST